MRNLYSPTFAAENVLANVAVRKIRGVFIALIADMLFSVWFWLRMRIFEVY
jgi:hypothetical protein